MRPVQINSNTCDLQPAPSTSTSLAVYLDPLLVGDKKYNMSLDVATVPFPYTQRTLPTILRGELSVVGGVFHKKSKYTYSYRNKYHDELHK